MKLTKKERALFIKYKPTVFFGAYIDTYDQNKGYVRRTKNGDYKTNLTSRIEGYLSLYSNDEIVICQRRAIKACIFKEEMDNILAEPAIEDGIINE